MDYLDDHAIVIIRCDSRARLMTLAVLMFMERGSSVSPWLGFWTLRHYYW
jgi:hypothetical protein